MFNSTKAVLGAAHRGNIYTQSASFCRMVYLVLTRRSDIAINLKINWFAMGMRRGLEQSGPI